MEVVKKITSLIVAFCILQWPSMQVNSASTASSNQLSYGKNTAVDQTKDSGSSGLMGAIYRKSRQSRCVTCYDDRYDDRSRYYGSYGGRSGDDRSSSWYYPRNDRYEERYRGADGDYDRYGYDRYETRGYSRRGSYGGESRGYGYDNREDYDRRYGGEYDRRYNEKRYDRGEMRGYGYDNRDRYYGAERGSEYPRDRVYDRPRYGSAGVGGGAGYGSYGYERDYHDRYSPRYGFRNSRPWDEAYRTQTGYEKSGSGVGSYYDKSGSGVGTYYGKSGAGVGSYYGKGVKEDRHYLPEPGYRSPCGVQKPNCPYGPQEGGTRVTSGTIDSGSHHKGVTQSIYNPSSDHSDNSKGTSSGWSYMREDDADRHPPRAGGNDSSGNGSGGSSSSSASNRNREQQSPAYGALLDRGSNLIAVEPAKTSEDGQENSDKTASSSSSSSSSSSASLDDNGQQNANGQNP